MVKVTSEEGMFFNGCYCILIQNGRWRIISKTPNGWQNDHSGMSSAN